MNMPQRGSVTPLGRVVNRGVSNRRGSGKKTYPARGMAAQAPCQFKFEQLGLHHRRPLPTLPDQFIEHGDMTNLYQSAGLDADTLRHRIADFMSNSPTTQQ